MRVFWYRTRTFLLIAVAAYNQMLSKSIAKQKIRMEKMISTLLRERDVYEQERTVVNWDLYLLRVPAEIHHPEMYLAHDSSMTQSHCICASSSELNIPFSIRNIYKTLSRRAYKQWEPFFWGGGGNLTSIFQYAILFCLIFWHICLLDCCFVFCFSMYLLCSCLFLFSFILMYLFVRLFFVLISLHLCIC